MDLSEYIEFFDDRHPLLIFLIVMRFIIAIYCGEIAKKLNRSEFGWFLFGLALPILALIIIQFIKPRFVWDSVSELDVSGVDMRRPKEISTEFETRELIWWIGYILVTFGAFKIFQHFFPVFDNSFLVPVILVVSGIALLIRNPDKTD
jgi:hypothetical protein